jgi:hypothetical protein
MAVQVKASVSYAEKMGQPNYGSIGAQCGIDIEITQDDLAAGRLQEEIRMGFEACRQAVKAELDRQVAIPEVETAPPPAVAPTVEQVKQSAYDACQSPLEMAETLNQWSLAKPVGQYREKWEPLLKEAKDFINGKVRSGQWSDYQVAVDQVKALESQMETVQQGEIAF